MKDLLAQLRMEPGFQMIMDDMKKRRPVVPEFAPQESRDANEVLLEQIKAESYKRQGFDLLFKLLIGS